MNELLKQKQELETKGWVYSFDEWENHNFASPDGNYATYHHDLETAIELAKGYEHRHPTSPAPVDILREKNERIAELEAEVVAAKKIIQGFADEPLPLINAVFWQQTAKTFLQAPHPAPVQAVTLSEEMAGLLVKPLYPIGFEFSDGRITWRVTSHSLCNEFERKKGCSAIRYHVETVDGEAWPYNWLEASVIDFVEKNEPVEFEDDEDVLNEQVCPTCDGDCSIVNSNGIAITCPDCGGLGI